MSKNEMNIANSSLDMIEWHKLCKIIADYCKTEGGKEKAYRIAPLANFDLAKEALLIAHEVYQATASGKFFPSFAGILEVSDALQQIEKGGSLAKEPLYDLLSTLDNANDILKHVDETFPEGSHFFKKYGGFRLHESVTRLRTEIFDNRGEIRDDATTHLYEVRQTARKLNEDVHGRLETLIKKQFQEDYFQDDFITIREDRLVLPLKANMKGKFKGIIHGSSNTGQTFFIEPEEVVEANNKLKVALQEEKREVERILREITQSLRHNIRSLYRAVDRVGDIEVEFAKARFAIAVRSEAIELLDSKKDFQIVKGRHPLLAAKHGDVVPNTLTLDGSVRGVVISGPNAGGKTVTLKMIGQLAAMASSGILPTASRESTIPYVKSLFVDLGDHQSLETGLSTFSSHLERIRAILDVANEDSLVLLDEIFMSTDPGEGTALAQAVLEELAKKGARIFCTTHFSKLKTFANDHTSFANASLKADPESGNPTYNLEFGLAGDSNALHLAKKMGIHERIVDRAYLLLAPDARDRVDVSVEKERVLKERKELEALQLRMLERERELEDEIERLKKERQHAVAEQFDSFLEELSEQRKRLREVSKALRPERASSAQKQLDRIRENATQKFSELEEKTASKMPKRIEDIQFNDVVKIRQLSDNGTVVTPPNKTGMVEVLVGSMRLEIHQDEIESVVSRAAQNQKKKSAPKERANGQTHNRENERIPFTPQTKTNTLDLRGYPLEEATEKLVRFLDVKSQDDHERLVVIHGHGSNRLKEGVRSFLSTCPYPIEYRAGQEGEGGSGVTLVAFTTH